MANSLMYPIALDKITKTLINAEDAVNGKACNCYCYECKQDMVAINNGPKQRPHFRHDINSNCSLSYESYIHWLTKEIFKEMTVLYLPDIESIAINSYIKANTLELYNSYKVPMKLREQINTELSEKVNGKLKKIKLDIVAIEQDYSTSLGNIRVDIVLKFYDKKGSERKLFIEPFFSNPIDDNKLNKLKELNVSTISIDLMSFYNKKGHLFSKNIFKGFLINNIDSKAWKYYNSDVLLNRNDYYDIENRIKNNYKNIAYHQSLLDNEKVINAKIDLMNSDIEILKSCVHDKKKELHLLNDKINNLKYI